jgi:hypothetical protein
MKFQSPMGYPGHLALERVAILDSDFYRERRKLFMEFWLTLLVALPEAVISTLRIYEWIKSKRKNSTD